MNGKNINFTNKKKKKKVKKVTSTAKEKYLIEMILVLIKY